MFKMSCHKRKRGRKREINTNKLVNQNQHQRERETERGRDMRIYDVRNNNNNNACMLAHIQKGTKFKESKKKPQRKREIDAVCVNDDIDPGLGGDIISAKSIKNHLHTHTHTIYIYAHQ